MKVVIDTNIFISGLISPAGNASKIIQQWHNNSLDIIISIPILDEIRKTLNYPKIIKIIKWDSQQIDQYIDFLYFFTMVVDTTNISFTDEIRDPNDIKIIKTFIAGKADYLITGDEDLLVLSDKYSIISPINFVKKFVV